jgi:hypothetical protein
MSKKKPAMECEPSSLAGTWVEEKNHFHTSTVVYTITADDGEVSVSGIDEDDGVKLRIQGTRWDGKKLYFTTLFPPTKHKASHVFSLIGRGRASHSVSYSDEDGHHTVNEVWKKRQTLSKQL